MKFNIKRLVIFLWQSMGLPGAWVFLLFATCITQLVMEKTSIELLILQSSFLVAYFLSRIAKAVEDIRDK